MAVKTRLEWLEEELLAAVRGAPPSAATYSVAVWCGEEQDADEDDDGPFDWVTVARGVSQWGLRRCVRVIHGHAWSDMTLLVQREGED